MLTFKRICSGRGALQTGKPLSRLAWRFFQQSRTIQMLNMRQARATCTLKPCFAKSQPVMLLGSKQNVADYPANKWESRSDMLNAPPCRSPYILNKNSLYEAREVYTCHGLDGLAQIWMLCVSQRKLPYGGATKEKIHVWARISALSAWLASSLDRAYMFPGRREATRIPPGVKSKRILRERI